MKNYVTEIIKDLIISILIIICIIIILSLVLYDKIAITRVIPETEQYFLTEEMEEEIENSKIEETQETVTTYYIDASDLRKYEKTNEYVKGKSNPFSMSSEDAGEVNSNSSSNTNNNGFYEDDGTK